MRGGGGVCTCCRGSFVAISVRHGGENCKFDKHPISGIHVDVDTIVGILVSVGLSACAARG